ncbi:MAG: hypothetical protein ACRD1T_26075, partial [Acidimicrobiia bacterium]
MWDLFDSFHDQPRQGESARNSEVDDVAAIGFSEYDPECYGDPKEDWWAAAFDNSTVDNTLIGRVHNDTRGSTAFGVETDSPSPMNPLPRIDHGYVSVALPHTFEPGGECSDFEELSAVGKYVHHEDGEGSWTVGFSASVGPAQANISYTGATPPNEPEVRVAGPVSVHKKFDPQGDSRPIVPTHLTYTGPTEARFHEQFTASARLTISSGPNAGQPVPDAPLRFRLGFGGDTQSCTATTNGSGVASCPLTPAQEGGRTTLTVQFNQRGEFLSSSVFVPFTIIRQATEVAYTGPT